MKQAEQQGIPNEDDAHSLVDNIILASLHNDNQINLECPSDPKSTDEALASNQSGEWRSAIEEELSSIKSMEVYELVPRSKVPSGRKVM